MEHSKLRKGSECSHITIMSCVTDQIVNPRQTLRLWAIVVVEGGVLPNLFGQIVP